VSIAMNHPLTSSARSRLEPVPGAMVEAASDVLAKPTSGAHAEHGPRLQWIRIAGIAVAIFVNSLAVFHASLPPSEHDSPFLPAQRADAARHALTVELLEAVTNELPEERAPPALDPGLPHEARRPPLPAKESAMPVPDADLPSDPAPRLRFSLSQLRPGDGPAPLPAWPRDPKAATAAIYRPPAITYEPTRFSDAWQSVSLADRARQSTFSYAAHCSLNAEMRQIRGCSREERNAILSAKRGTRVDTALRPDGVD
jgi:hypothetical protein